MKQQIAMKCTQEQFDAVKPKLKGFRMGYITDFNTTPYLINYGYGDDSISNCTEFYKNEHTYKHEVFEEWNEKIFLEACGIETEKTFSITESQIKEIHEKTSVSNQEQIQEWFPSVFKTDFKLECGKWYWSQNNALWCVVKKEEKSLNHESYGFNSEGKWSHLSDRQPITMKEATEQEVFEALKNEAVKRGFKEGVYYLLPNKDWEAVCGKTMMLNPQNHQILYFGDHCIFKEGVWAEIIPTITLSEAEQQLGKKIIF